MLWVWHFAVSTPFMSHCHLSVPGPCLCTLSSIWSAHLTCHMLMKTDDHFFYTQIQVYDPKFVLHRVNWLSVIVSDGYLINFPWEGWELWSFSLNTLHSRTGKFRPKEPSAHHWSLPLRIYNLIQRSSSVWCTCAPHSFSHSTCYWSVGLSSSFSIIRRNTPDVVWKGVNPPRRSLSQVTKVLKKYFNKLYLVTWHCSSIRLT